MANASSVRFQVKDNTTKKVSGVTFIPEYELENRVQAIVDPIISNIENQMLAIHDNMASLGNSIAAFRSVIDNLNNIYAKADVIKNYATKNEISEIYATKNDLQSINQLNTRIVSSLPDPGEENTIYFVPNEDDEEENTYKEYMLVNGEYELIGSAKIGYPGEGEPETISDADIESIFHARQ